MTDNTELLIDARGLKRFYQRGPNVVKALDGVDLTVRRGELVAVVGASGSGKSTLLNLVAGLDTPTAGELRVGGEPLNDLSPRELAAYRAHRIGMIFQSFNLLPHRTAAENVELALMFDDTPRTERESRVGEMLAELGLDDRHDHRPADMSGGEQQRVAVARALIKRPELLLADEPTGNLDHDNSQLIASLLHKLNRTGLTVLMVTHDRDLAARCAHRTIEMHYGQIVSDRAESGGAA